MNKTLVVGMLGAFVVGVIGGYLVNNHRPFDNRYGMMGTEGRNGRNDDNDRYRTSPTRPATPGAMDHSMHMGAEMSVSSERDFLEKMIPHHEEAVATAKEVLARGATTPEMKQLAENIITAQEKEIADMKSWYQNWYGVAYTTNDSYAPMMRDLEALSGKEIDTAFLEDMIMHHMGAIMMAAGVEAHIEHPEIRTLSLDIKATQSEEITTMRDLLTKI